MTLWPSWSKAQASGARSKERGFESHRCHNILPDKVCHIYECILNKIKVHTYVHTNRNVRNKFRSYFIYCRSHKYSLFGPCGDANINKSFHVYLLPSKVHGM